MLKTLSIENFRGFKHFELSPLGRINLLVGANNSGKTSLLEAIYLLLDANPLSGLNEICRGRNEYSFEEDNSPRLPYQRSVRLHIAHLMYGHNLFPGKSVKISATLNNGKQHQFSLTPLNEDNLQGSLSFDGFEPLDEVLRLEIRSLGHLTEPLEARLSSQGMLTPEDVRRSPKQTIRSRESRQQSKSTPVQLVRTLGLSTGETTDLFDKISLTPKEDLVTQTLKTIEPRLQRIASEGNVKRYSSDSFARSGLKVRLEGQDQPIPIGSMGEGMWRMLGLALAIVNAKDGILLVDEIDTGLHFTAMGEMWRMICKTAKDLNVQIFATTHSSDCWQSLGELVETETVDPETVTVHRLEPSQSQSIALKGRQIAIAADRGLEVR